MNKYITLLFLFATLCMIAGCTQKDIMTSTYQSSRVENHTNTENIVSDDTESLVSENTATEQTDISSADSYTSSISSQVDIISSYESSSNFTPSYNSSSQTSSVLPFDDTAEELEYEYLVKQRELYADYQRKKFNTETEWDNALVSNSTRRNEIETSIKQLQFKCTNETNPLKTQITELQKKKIEAESLASTNSYYKTLAQQYENQISSLNSQITQIENKYGQEIKVLKNEFSTIPTTDEGKLLKEEALKAVDNWYELELAKLNAQYGK